MDTWIIISIAAVALFLIMMISFQMPRQNRSPIGLITIPANEPIASNPVGVMATSGIGQYIRICGTSTTEPLFSRAGTSTSQIQFVAGSNKVAAFDKNALYINGTYPITFGNSTTYFTLVHNVNSIISTSSASIIISSGTGAVATFTTASCTLTVPLTVTNNLTTTNMICSALTSNGNSSCSSLIASSNSISVSGTFETSYTNIVDFVNNTRINGAMIDSYILSIM
jgi:hypothetical protein